MIRCRRSRNNSTSLQDDEGLRDPDREARLIAAMEDYCLAAEQGQPIVRQQLLDRHGDIADELAECLAGVEFIQGAAEQLHDGVVAQRLSAAL